MHSIISEERKCFICGSCRGLELHHIFGAANRKNSTRYGLVVYLCHTCHNEPPYGVHYNKEMNDYLKKVAQIKFNIIYQDLDFLKIFGKNYI